MDSALEPQRPFPASAGILLGASLCMHLAAVIHAVFANALPASALFLAGQFAASLAILRLVDGKWVFQDLRVFFVVAFFLYGGTLPGVVALGFGGETGGMAGAACMYATALFGFNVVQWWYRQPWRDVPAESFDKIRPSFSNAVVLLVASVAVAGYAVTRGYAFQLTIDRGQVLLLGTQVWVVSMFVFNGLAMFMLAGWGNLNSRARLLLLGSIAFFVLFQLSLGNRRDFLPMFLFVVGIVATRRQSVVRFGTIVAGFAGFLALTLIGLLREVMGNPAVLLQRTPIQLLVTQSEFVSPIQTLMHYIDVSRPLRWGWTYIAAPSLFVPRAFWPDKPESLSLQFMRDKFGSISLMGFAYTPVTEAFINFGWLGPFVMFSLLSIIMVKLVRNADLYPGLYFFAFAYVIDFNRGDFGGTLYSLIFVAGGYAMMRFISRLRWAPARLSVGWRAAPVSVTVRESVPNR